MFANWLREKKSLNPDEMPRYMHEFEDGRAPVWARAYPNELLAEFRSHFSEVWIRYRATRYFQQRDATALEFLPKLLPPPGKSKK